MDKWSRTDTATDNRIPTKNGTDNQIPIKGIQNESQFAPAQSPI
jgi:hypothetical protein